MSSPFFKESIVKRTLLNHVISVSGFVFVVLALMYLQVPEEEFISILILPIFLGFFFIGILIYGFFGVLIRSIFLANLILKNVDLNRNSSKDEIKIYILFSVEVAISITFFFVVAMIFPEAISLQLLFDALVMKFGKVSG